MDSIFFDLIDLWKNPSIAETLVDILLCAVPIWVAVTIGLLIGWSWRPRWTGLVFLGLRSKFRFFWTAFPPGFGTRRLWLAFTALSASRSIWNYFKGKSVKSPHHQTGAGDSDVAFVSSSKGERREEIITEDDLEHLLQLLEGKDGLMEWQTMMERTTSNMAYQAWIHEPRIGPYILRSRTVFEDATPELVRDFFWDDEFRPKWDPMLGYFKILEECSHTGTMIVHWIKKFPFFCSDREYIIGRRIWEAGKTYYCITKGVPYSGLHKRDKPRRVNLYFSSWVIKAVESRKADGQNSACEVTLLHYEDMGIPKDAAKLGVRHGMWGTVKKLHSGMRTYQTARRLEASPSRCALMARITTKISSDESMDYFDSGCLEEDRGQLSIRRQEDDGIDWKWIVIGGTVALVFGLRSGVIGSVLLRGAGQRTTGR